MIHTRLDLDKPWYHEFGRYYSEHFFLGRLATAGPASATRSPGNTGVLSGQVRDKEARAAHADGWSEGAATFWLLIRGPRSGCCRQSSDERPPTEFHGVRALRRLRAGLLARLGHALRLLADPAVAARQRYVPSLGELTTRFLHIILPWTMLAILFAAIYARITRDNLLETLGEDYIRTARAKGLPERTVILKHGLRSSLTPIVTMFGMDVALLVGGAIITESVFNLQGLGWLAITSAQDQGGPADAAGCRQCSPLPRWP